MMPTCDKCGILLERKFSNPGDTLHQWLECPECGAKDDSKEAKYD